MPCLRLAAAALVALALAAPAARGDPAASPLLPPDHWAVRAADRLEQLGLVDGWLPAQRAVPVRAVASALAEGAARALERRPELATEVAAWRDRFRREWRLGDPAGLALTGGWVGAGLELGSVRQVTTPSPLPSAIALTAPPDDPFVEAGLAVGLGPHLALGGAVVGTPWRADFPAFEAVAALGKWSLSAGRARVGFGFNEIGGVVLSGAAPLDRVELSTAAPLELPASLGLLTVDFLVAWMSEPRHPYSPLLAGLSLQWRPHPRLTVGIQRGLMFGGGPYTDLTFGEKLQDLFWPFEPVKPTGTGGNNVYSASFRWRVPTDPLLPLTLRIEWGTDDNPGAAEAWPGLVAGISAPRLPGLPASLGLEYAYFGRGPGLFFHHDPFPWYSHGGYYGGWVVDQTPLGDPLGGNGNAVRAIATVWVPGCDVRVTFRAWSARRFQDNLRGPGAGRDPGVRGEVVVPLGGYEVSARGQYAAVDGGRSASLMVSVKRYL